MVPTEKKQPKDSRAPWTPSHVPSHVPAVLALSLSPFLHHTLLDVRVFLCVREPKTLWRVPALHLSFNLHHTCNVFR